MMIRSLMAASCLFVAAGAQAQQLSSTSPYLYAQPEFYVGLNYAQVSLDFEMDEIKDVLDISPDWNSVGLNFGYQPSPYLALEARYGRGVGSDDLLDGAVDTKMKHYFGIYALPQIPIQDFMSVYGLLGWTKAKFEIKSALFPDYGLPYKMSDSEDDFSYGIGMRFKDKSHVGGVGFFVEYARLIDRSDYDIDSLMLGLSWHF
ncbi:hypothetical protein CGX12_18975 [Zobellella denitrificans]|uniref:porin family protein n=1 Tax=Zobellella denitrificans TaxID=347534 RepID=UPI000B8BF8EC|nr:porin family protein [Zobellella denitrificans]OXS13574.1 hypothetical protein CGX12_18975 [Zobellella denitrificans]